MAKNVDDQPKPHKRKVGRPTNYTLELATRICEATATSTESYDILYKDNADFPARDIMRLWRYYHPQFKAMYEVAKQAQADLYVEEMRERARDRSRDIIDDIKGLKANPAAVARDKLIIDTDKWIACKLIPKVYGTKEEDKPAFSDTEKTEIKNILNELVAKHDREY